MDDASINGVCDERFARVRAAFEKNFALDLELGACFALAIEGELLVDLWGGYADVQQTRPWQEDTLASVYSCAKIPMSLCGLMLLDRELIELDAPVARYWPEFAAAGKSQVRVRDIFCHSSGVGGIDPPYDWKIASDWEYVVARLASQAPWYEPGKQTGYQGLTFHYLIGELIRRTTGMLPDRFMREEVTDKIGADYVFELSDAEAQKLAEADRPPLRTMQPDSYSFRAVGALSEALPLTDPRWRRSPENGFAYGNARSLTKLGSILAGGGALYGHRFLSPETVRLAHQEHAYAYDPFLESSVRRGLGMGLASKEFPLPFPNAFHWGGYGGSSVIMEPDRRICWSYVPTKLDSAIGIDSRGTRLNKAACIDSAALL